MTLVELVLSAALTTATLGLLLLASTSSRANAAYYRHTRQSLLALHQALLEYHNQYGHYPDEPASAVIATLLRDPVTAPILGPVPLKISNSTIADGYGRPLKYIGPKNSDTDQPDFISAGPDGRFGCPKTDVLNASHATIDNLYASDMEAVQ